MTLKYNCRIIENPFLRFDSNCRLWENNKKNHNYYGALFSVRGYTRPTLRLFSCCLAFPHETTIIKNSLNDWISHHDTTSRWIFPRQEDVLSFYLFKFCSKYRAKSETNSLSIFQWSFVLIYWLKYKYIHFLKGYINFIAKYVYILDRKSNARESDKHQSSANMATGIGKFKLLI